MYNKISDALLLYAQELKVIIGDTTKKGQRDQGRRGTEARNKEKTDTGTESGRQ